MPLLSLARWLGSLSAGADIKEGPRPAKVLKAVVGWPSCVGRVLYSANFSGATDTHRCGLLYAMACKLPAVRCRGKQGNREGEGEGEGEGEDLHTGDRRAVRI